tara:strand:- start:1101 stop:1286 length:186 start_codon:yes stop_codon:yes gene_type:complete
MNTQQQIDTKRSLNRQGVAEKIPTILVEMGENGSTATQHIRHNDSPRGASLQIRGLAKPEP